LQSSVLLGLLPGADAFVPALCRLISLGLAALELPPRLLGFMVLYGPSEMAGPIAAAALSPDAGVKQKNPAEGSNRAAGC
jgi:hypothetical protein